MDIYLDIPQITTTHHTIKSYNSHNIINNWRLYDATTKIRIFKKNAIKTQFASPKIAHVKFQSINFPFLGDAFWTEYFWLESLWKIGVRGFETISFRIVMFWREYFWLKSHSNLMDHMFKFEGLKFEGNVFIRTKYFWLKSKISEYSTYPKL